jgi:endonuclease-3
MNRKKERALLIHSILSTLFPDPAIPLNHYSPFTLLVAVLLSAQCTDARVNQVTPALFARADTPQALAQLTPQDIEPLIRPCGLAPTKARHIVALSRQLVERYDGKVPADLHALEQLPGVGHKTASVVLVQAFGTPAFPVDTHIHRSAKRWGLSTGRSVAQTEKDLKRLFPRHSWGLLHLQIIHFARRYCPARGHIVQQCPICSRLITRPLAEPRRYKRSMKKSPHLKLFTDISSSVEVLINDYRALFEQHRNPDRASRQSRYLRDQFPFFGIPMPQLTQLVRQQGYPPADRWKEVVERLYEEPEREFHYTALFIARKHAERTTQELALYERLITRHSWWDTVDTIAPHLVGPLVLRLPQLLPQVAAWRHSTNLWLRRTSIIYSLRYKQQTDREALFTTCTLLAEDPEFFIRKAIGWALREYGKVAPHEVRAYLDRTQTLSPLSRREASRRLSQHLPH